MPVILDNSPEYLEVNGVPLYTPAWIILNHTPLRLPPDTVGRNRRLSRGRVVPMPKYATETVRSLRLHVFGSHDIDGNLYPDSRAGLDANIDFLMANVDTTLLTAPPFTRTAVWHPYSPVGGPLAEPRSAEVQARVELGEDRKAGARCIGTLALTIMGGRFV